MARVDRFSGTQESKQCWVSQQSLASPSLRVTRSLRVHCHQNNLVRVPYWSWTAKLPTWCLLYWKSQSCWSAHLPSLHSGSYSLPDAAACDLASCRSPRNSLRWLNQLACGLRISLTPQLHSLFWPLLRLGGFSWFWEPCWQLSRTPSSCLLSAVCWVLLYSFSHQRHLQ